MYDSVGFIILGICIGYLLPKRDKTSPSNVTVDEDEKDIFNNIVDYLYRQCSEEDVQLSTEIENLNLDSLDKVEFIMWLEDEYDFLVCEKESLGFVLVSDVVTYVKNHK